MFIGIWNIDDLVTFTVNTHNPTTGAAADADVAPAYRVYEDETGAAILSGSMALLDAANTTGLYSEQITLSAANGFEVGKTYTIYISATVGGVTGTTSRTLQVEALATAAAVAALGGTKLTITSVINGNNISVFNGDTWEFTLSGLGDIAGYEVFAFIVKSNAGETDAQAMLYVRSDDGLVWMNRATPISAGNGALTPGSGEVSLLVAMAETASAKPGAYTWWIKAFDTTPTPDEAFTLAKGNFQINHGGVESITP